MTLAAAGRHYDIEVMLRAAAPERDVMRVIGAQDGVRRVEPWERSSTTPARADGLRSARGLVWTIRCADDQRVVAQTDPVLGHTPWREFSTAFQLPAQGCAGQWLQLSVPARIRAEQRIGGRAWFDDLRIVRVAATEPRPTSE